jgi:polyhydroxybutyrate depolymerase
MKIALALIAVPLLLIAIDAAWFHADNRTNGAIVSSGDKREYLLYVPSSYDRNRPVPLVISLHGGAMWPAQQRHVSRWNEVADEHGFLVVYPGGRTLLGTGGRHRVWNVNRGPGLGKDVRFISDLIDDLQARYNIDPARIYLNGLSNGGGMSFVLSCKLSDRIAAVGMVGAAQSLPWSWCTDDRPVPMISFHGTADGFVPYRGGGSVASQRPFPSTPVWTANWARRNRCDANAMESPIAPDVTRIEYPNCEGNAAVVLYRIDGGGHTWPGGEPMPEWMVGPTSTGVDASREMWAFFRAHPLPSHKLHGGP